MRNKIPALLQAHVAQAFGEEYRARNLLLLSAAEKLGVKLNSILEKKNNGATIDGVYSVSMSPKISFLGIADIMPSDITTMQRNLADIYEKCRNHGLDAEAAMTRESDSRWSIPMEEVTQLGVVNKDGKPLLQVRRNSELHLFVKASSESNPATADTIRLAVPGI